VQKETEWIAGESTDDDEQPLVNMGRGKRKSKAKVRSDEQPALARQDVTKNPTKKLKKVWQSEVHFKKC
jgi:hypothetical protein